MKLLVTLLITVFTFQASAFLEEPLPIEGYCGELANAQFEIEHGKKIDDWGVIQGFSAMTDVFYNSDRLEIDNLDETFTYIINQSNDEGDYWVNTYVIKYNVWLSASVDGRPATCDFIEIEDRGVTAEGNIYEEDNSDLF